MGGDEREQEIARLAARTGAWVRAYGFPWPAAGIDRVTLAGSAVEAMEDADHAFLPIPRGVGDTLYAPDAAEPIRIGRELFAPLRAGAHVFCGRVTDALAEAWGDLPITMHEYDPDRELMLLRAAAIVEGVIQTAIVNTDITIHGASVAVVGFGNIGSVLTRRLLALGADVHVAARNPIQRAAALADGARGLPLEGLAELAPRLSMIFSTVPARIVDHRVLERLPPGSLVLDIVPPPDRSDLDVAASLGHRAVWARGLGRRAPITVGGSQWLGIRRMIEAIELAKANGS
ncbi:MAG: dipicolinate synthase subunit DpsA [Actinomycetota bacterium]